MSAEDRQRWDRRYADGSYVPRPQPSPFLVSWLDRLAPGREPGRALDVATGAGRNALLLAEAGFAVTAIDGSSVAIEMAQQEAARRGLDVTWQVADLDDLDLGRAAWDLIVVVRYRDPLLWPRLVDALATDGYLIVEHHLRTDADVDGPTSNEFRLRPQELLEAFRDLRILHYSEQLEHADDPDRTYALARLVACNGDPGF